MMKIKMFVSIIFLICLTLGLNLTAFSQKKEKAAKCYDEESGSPTKIEPYAKTGGTGTVTTTTTNGTPTGTATATGTWEVGVKATIEIGKKKKTRPCTEEEKAVHYTNEWNRLKWVRDLYLNLDNYLRARGVIIPKPAPCPPSNPVAPNQLSIAPCGLEQSFFNFDMDETFFSWKSVNVYLPWGLQTDFNYPFSFDFEVTSLDGRRQTINAQASLDVGSLPLFQNVYGYTIYSVTPIDQNALNYYLGQTVYQFGGDDNVSINIKVNIPLQSGINYSQFQGSQTIVRERGYGTLESPFLFPISTESLFTNPINNTGGGRQPMTQVIDN